jgi:glycerol-3-phosphate dehydrogenase (NAD(P)+)
MVSANKKIAILGGGSWGTTLSLLAERAGHRAWIWMRDAGIAQVVQSSRRNEKALPGITIPESIIVSGDLELVCHSADAILIATASTAVRSVAQMMKPFIEDALVVSCAKGLECDSLKRMTEVLDEELNPESANRVCALSGPNLAVEIAIGKPATTVVAGYELAVAEQVQDLLISAQFRPYTNEDVIGVEMAGALKNIIAIGAGIGDGMGAGDNAKAAFMTRGLAEVARLGVAVGASPLTFAGLAGLGDLVATCASTLSRNHFVGKQLSKGKTLTEIQAEMSHIAEGVFTTAAAHELARRHDIEMPITEQLYSVLYENKPALTAIADLMQRESQHEIRGVYGLG